MRLLKVVADEFANRPASELAHAVVHLLDSSGNAPVTFLLPRDEGVTAHKRRTVIYPLVGRYPLMGRFLNAVIRRPSLRLRGK